MVKNNERQLDNVFHALSDATRRAILARLADGECNVTELAKPFSMSLAAVSKHLKVLEVAGLIRKQKDGRTFRCRPDFEQLADANRLLEQYAIFWQDRLCSLERFLETDNTLGDKSSGSISREDNPKARHQKSNKSKKGKSV